MARKRKQHWSYNTGDRGINWVRVYADGRDGKLYMEWRETVTDPETGARKEKRRRVRVKTEDREEAKERGRAFADKLKELASRSLAPVGLGGLITMYLEEVTPTKGSKGSRDHDHAAARVFRAFFRAQPEKERRLDRHPSTLDRVDWDRFIAQRGGGRIPGYPRAVGKRSVAYDLKFLIAVLNWAVGTRREDKQLLEVSPWRPEVRKSQGWVMPKEPTPAQPGMSTEIREGLIRHAPGWQFAAALVLERETRRRNSAIRRLRWSDIDLEDGTARWRGELDKNGRANVTPLTPAAVDQLKKLPSRGIGEAPVFPAAKDPANPTPRNTFQTWLRRAKERWLKAVEDEGERERLARQLERVGFHSALREGIRDPQFRALPPRIQEELAGKSFETIRGIYDHVSVEDMRDAMKGALTGTR